MGEYREPVPAQLPHGTVVQLRGESHPRVVGLKNQHGDAIAYMMPRTPSGKHIHTRSASIDVRTGGTVDENDIKSKRKHILTRPQFFAALGRGHRENIAAGHYTKDMADTLTEGVRDNWPKDSGEK